MYQRSSFRSRRPRSVPYGTVFGTLGIVAVLAGLFAYGIWWFRFAPKNEPSASTSDTIVDVLTPTPVASAVIAAAEGTSNEATLHDPKGGSSFANAERETDGGQFFLSIKASLPDVDRETYAYEAWLLRQVPYDYFSVGDFVTNDVGEWVLEWSASTDSGAGKYDAYTQIVVTVESKDGNPDPSRHVLEGEFE